MDFKMIWGIEEIGNPLAMGNKEKERMTFMILALDGITKHRRMRDSELTEGMRMSFWTYCD